MTENVTRTTLFSAPDKNIFSIINDRSNVSDPKNPNNLGRKFVYRNDPWSKGSDYDGYPYIVLRFPKMERDNSSGDGNTKDISWSQEVIVRSKMGGGVNNADGTSKAVTDMQSILDDLNQTFDSKTVKDQLRANNMFNLVLSVEGDDEFEDSNNKHIFETTLRLVYSTRLQVGV
jgi:hypothetical protein